MEGGKLKERKDPQHFSSLDKVSKLYSLNEKQHIEFSIAGKALFSAYLLCLESKEEVSPLRMYIGGEGGTRKSQIIKAIMLLAESWNIKSSARTVAPTGIAAVQVSGQTVDSFFKTPPKGSRPAEINDEHRIMISKVF